MQVGRVVLFSLTVIREACVNLCYTQISEMYPAMAKGLRCNTVANVVDELQSLGLFEMGLGYRGLWRSGKS